METIQFSPLIVGTMRLGVWGANLDTKALEEFIEKCLALGLRDFDHADIYGHYTTEAAFGKVLQRRPDLSKQIQVTTKCGIKLISENRPSHLIKSYDSSKAHILAAIDASLKALHREQIDVLLLHRPDYLMHPQEIAGAFEQAKKQGKVKAFGVSNFNPSQFDLLNSFTPLITNQIEISINHLDAFENGSLDQLLKLNIRPTAWSPMAGGRLFSPELDEQSKRIVATAKPLCEKYNCALDQLLYAWLNTHPAKIISVSGSAKIERIEAALKAQSIQIDKEDWYTLLEASKGHEVA